MIFEYQPVDHELNSFIQPNLIYKQDYLLITESLWNKLTRDKDAIPIYRTVY